MITKKKKNIKKNREDAKGCACACSMRSLKCWWIKILWQNTKSCRVLTTSCVVLCLWCVVFCRLKLVKEGRIMNMREMVHPWGPVIIEISDISPLHQFSSFSVLVFIWTSRISDSATIQMNPFGGNEWLYLRFISCFTRRESWKKTKGSEFRENRARPMIFFFFWRTADKAKQNFSDWCNDVSPTPHSVFLVIIHLQTLQTGLFFHVFSTLEWSIYPFLSFLDGRVDSSFCQRLLSGFRALILLCTFSVQGIM